MNDSCALALGWLLLLNWFLFWLKSAVLEFRIWSGYRGEVRYTLNWRKYEKPQKMKTKEKRRIRIVHLVRRWESFFSSLAVPSFGRFRISLVIFELNLVIQFKYDWGSAHDLVVGLDILD